MEDYTPEAMNVNLMAHYKKEYEKYKRWYEIAALVAVLFLALFGWSVFYIIATR